MALGKNFLIWSFEHDAWWRPNRCGYTKVRSEAGVYEITEALDIVNAANFGDEVNEALVPWPVRDFAA